MNVDHLLEQIKREADGLRTGDPSLADEDAYLQAIVTVIRTEAEKEPVKPIQERILLLFCALAPYERSQPVTTTTILKNIPDLKNLWTVWYYTKPLEESGYIYRPFGAGSRRGFKLTRDGLALVEEIKRRQHQPATLAG